MPINTQPILLKTRRTKIIATVGPTSQSEIMIEQLIIAGVNVFRLNMSHGTHEEHKHHFNTIRNTAQKLNKCVGILADLCGPKIRTGTFEDSGIHLVADENIIITTQQGVGKKGLIVSQYERLHKDVKSGDRILLNDGLFELQVETINYKNVGCKVIQGGFLTDHKGINLPDSYVSTPSLTQKDKLDAQFSLDLGVDFLALSFVRTAEDILELKSIIQQHNNHASVIAKIERPEALENGDAILDIAEGIMVARGDLGVELPPEQVPLAQQLLIDHARDKNKVVIVATQMLESMITNVRPTRAEVSDVYHSVIGLTDGIMLSGETAVGAHPIAAVRMMDRVAHLAEAYLWKKNGFGDGQITLPSPNQLTRGSISNEQTISHPAISFARAVARSTALLSRDLMVRGIVVVSHSGITACAVSAARPEAPVLAITWDMQAYYRMSLLWGVIPVLIKEEMLEDINGLARKLAQDYGLAQPHDSILVVRGFNHSETLNTPSVTALTI